MFDDKVLALDGVGKDFGSVAALKEVSCGIGAGEILCLVGRSGCGKSTMLRLIGGIERPDRGSIILNGREIAGPQNFVEPDKRQIGFVFQDYALFPHLTVEDNIAFGIRSLSSRERERRVAEMLELVGLEPMAKRYAHSLSGGEQQRIALARAMAPRPKLILMDEPFSNLDLNLKRRVRSETIALLRQVNATAIMVTHDPQEALMLGDHVVLLNNGEVVQQGTGDDLYHRPVSQYAAEFFSDFNIIEGVVEGNVVSTRLGRFPNINGLASGLQCKVYIRPHGVQFVHEDDEDQGFDANLVARHFMGDIEELVYQLFDASISFKMNRFAGKNPAPVRARLNVIPQAVLIFDA